jgi:hypothetical protein
MLGSLIRLSMLAGTGAGMAAGFRRALVKLAVLFAITLVSGLMFAGAIGYFGFAVYLTLVPEIGPAWGAAAAGGLLLMLAAVLALVGRLFYSRRPRPVAPAGLGGPLGAAALGASMGPGLDLKGALGRHALTVLLTAFIAGMVMNNRR